MPATNIVAVYPSRSIAEQARSRLVESGVPEQYIRLGTRDFSPQPATAGPAATTGTQTSDNHDESFFDWLFGASATDDEDRALTARLSGERTAVSVLTQESEADRVGDVLLAFDPVDLREHGETIRDDVRRTQVDTETEGEKGEQKRARRGGPS